jgi:Flp pilus assembly protein TadG
MVMQSHSKTKARQRGNVTLIFALTSVATVGMIGGGIEMTRIVDGRGKLQAASDAAALAAAGMEAGTPNGQRGQIARKVARANVRNSGSMLPSTLRVDPDFSLSDRVTVELEVKISTILSQSVFGEEHTIKVSSTAQKATAAIPAVPGTSPTPVCVSQPAATDAPPQPVSPPVVTTTAGTPSPAAKGCVWALGQGNVNGAITFNSGNQINAPTCQMHVHSTDNDAVFHNWGNDITIDKLYAKGRINQNKPAGPNFVSYAGTNVLDDPFATGLPQLAEGACVLGSNWTSFDSSTVTLNPGTYCGGINFNSGVNTITLNPGVYHIKEPWNINGAVVNGTGVTLYFPGDANFQMNGNTRLNLSAPTSGATAGLLMYEKYGANQGTRAIDARGGLNIKGVVYFPTKQLNFNSGNNVTSAELMILARVIHFNDSDFNMSPYAGALPTGVTLPGGTPGTSTSVPGPAPVSSGSGLLVNGSFEQPVLPVGTEAFLSSIPGWTSTKRFEIHNSYFTGWSPGGYGTDGVQYGEIERDMSQTVTLEAGKTYRFAFDYRFGHAGGWLDAKFDVIWGDKTLATIQTSVLEPWRRISFPVRGTGMPVTFKFAQLPGANDDHGAFLDRVRIEEDNTLTPPADGCPGGLPAPPAAAATPAVPAKLVRLIR